MLPPGVLLIHRDACNCPLPPELTLVPRSTLPQAVRSLLTAQSVRINRTLGHIVSPNSSTSAAGPGHASMQQHHASASATAVAASAHTGYAHLVPAPPGGVNSGGMHGDELAILEAVQVHLTFALPPGTVLAPGVVVLARPPWLFQLPASVELVSTINLNILEEARVQQARRPVCSRRRAAISPSTRPPC